MRNRPKRSLEDGSGHVRGFIGWYRVQFPILVSMAGGGHLTFFNSHAPAATLNQLGGALLAGSMLILPALFYLLRVFKLEGRA